MAIPAEKRFTEFKETITTSGIANKKNKDPALKSRKKDFKKMVKASARRTDFFASSENSDDEDSNNSSKSHESTHSFDPYMKKQAQLAQKLEETAS